MMKFLRKKGVMHVLLWGIAVVVILSFGVLGNAYLLTGKSDQLKYAGKVFGKKISVEDFENTYKFVVTQAKLQYGKNFDQVAPMLKLEEQTWDRIILLQEAKRQHIKIPDEDVIANIRRFPFFYNENTKNFDPKIYQMVLNRGLRTSAQAFEEGIRNSLKISTLFQRQTFAVSITENNVLEAYKQQNEKVRVSYVLFPLTDHLKEVVFDEIQVKNYFLEHKKDFVQPAAINVSYITFPFEKDNEDAKSKAYDTAFAALSSLHSGEDFSAVADADNLSITETGFFDPQKPDLSTGWPLDVFQGLLSMRPGQYSDLIATDNGFYILRLREIRPPFYPAYDQAKEEVKDAWKDSAALELSKNTALKALPAFQTEKDFKAVSQTQGLTVYDTPDFTLGQYLPELGMAPAFQQTAFTLTQEQPLSNVVETEKGYAILHLEARLPADMEKFEEEKAALGQQVLERKKEQVFERYIEVLKKKANLEDLISEHLKR